MNKKVSFQKLPSISEGFLLAALKNSLSIITVIGKIMKVILINISTIK
jgi:hypothetical protein